MRSRLWFSGLATVGVAMLGVPAVRALAQEPPQAPAASDAQTASAKAEEYERRADAYRKAGMNYKNGVLRFTDAEANYYQGEAIRQRAAPLTPEAEADLKWVEELEGMGGSPYKTGVLRRAEEDARRYPPGSPSVAPAKSGVYQDTPPEKPWLE